MKGDTTMTDQLWEALLAELMPTAEEVYGRGKNDDDDE